MQPHSIRQGDIYLIAIDPARVPADARPQPRDPQRGLILAEGEVTGHHHAVLERDAELLRADGPSVADQVDAWLRTGASGAQLRHPEHGTITLQPDTTYVVVRQREYHPEQLRRVAD